MELFDLMKNIRGSNKEEVIKNAIYDVKNKLNNLTFERTCKIYNSYVYDELKKYHIQSRIINTLDLTEGYEHVFLLLPKELEEDIFYIIDLTYEQFLDFTDSFNELKTNGYQIINSQLFSLYLNRVTGNEFFDNINIGDIYYQNKNIKH